jgi:hypothetical protein
LWPILESIAPLDQQIRSCGQQIEILSRERYPQARSLCRAVGVGPLPALAFVLTLQDPTRFRKTREVGPALGLVPRRDQSGNRDPQLRITKTRTSYLRRLLINCAQCIPGPFGPDCDLRHRGLRPAERGGKNAKKRAVVAVARKLAILRHHLWSTGQVYDASYAQSSIAQESAALSLAVCSRDRVAASPRRQSHTGRGSPASRPVRVTAASNWTLRGHRQRDGSTRQLRTPIGTRLKPLAHSECAWK